MKIKKLIDGLKVTNKNLLLAIIFLYISCVLVVIPFINAFTIREFYFVFLACLGLGIGVFSITLFCFFVFYKLQTCIEDLTMQEIIVKSAFVLTFEYTFFAIFSFISMLFPPVFIALGILLVFVFCACNIYILYNTYEEKTKDKQALFRFSKIYNICIITILICIWLIC